MVPACALLLSCSESTDDGSPGDGVDQLERRLELRHHEALLPRMTAPDSSCPSPADTWRRNLFWTAETVTSI